MSASAPLKQIKMTEVKEHKTAKSCWIVLQNKVYDVTKWLNEHPGGEDVLLEHGGGDGSKDFEDAGHSQDAIELKKKYLIGELVEADRVPDKKGKK